MDFTIIGVDAPQGFEFAGEFRHPRTGDWYMNEIGIAYLAEQKYKHQSFMILNQIDPDPVCPFCSSEVQAHTNGGKYWCECTSYACNARFPASTGFPAAWQAVRSINLEKGD